MKLPTPPPFLLLGCVQFFAGLVILIYPQDTLSAAVVEHFGGIATPLFIGAWTAFCGLIILYTRLWRRRFLPHSARTILAAPLLLYCVTVFLIARNPLIVLIVFQLTYFILYETGFRND